MTEEIGYKPTNYDPPINFANCDIRILKNFDEIIEGLNNTIQDLEEKITLKDKRIQELENILLGGNHND